MEKEIKKQDKNKEEQDQVKNISKRQIKMNLEDSRKKAVLLYVIPLIILIIIAVIYIPTHKNWLLVPFAILMFIALFGHDGATRTCPHCKKWNSVIYNESKNYTRTITEESTTLFGKKKSKTKKEKIRKYFGECQNCKYKVDSEKKRYF